MGQNKWIGPDAKTMQDGWDRTMTKKMWMVFSDDRFLFPTMARTRRAAIEKFMSVHTAKTWRKVTVTVTEGWE